MSLNDLFRGSMLVLLAVVLGMGATVANAQNPSPKITDIHKFVSCLNSITKTPQTVADSVRCVPPNCFYTVTMSLASAQPACMRHDVMLPRVIFSCPGPSAVEQFRPSFTLCPDNINHIEVGEDINPSHNQKMGDVNSPPAGPNFMSISEFGTGDLGVLNTTTNHKGPCVNGACGCVLCHGAGNPDHLAEEGETLLISAPLFPSVQILDTNDPDVTKPSSPVPLSDICAAIESSSALASDPNVNFTLEIQLCERLDGKVQSN